MHDRIKELKLSQYAHDVCILNRATNPDHATMRLEWAAEAIINYYTKWWSKCNIEKIDASSSPRKTNAARQEAHDLIIGYYVKTDLEIKLAIIQACMLPLLDYGVVQLLSRYCATNLSKIERQYRLALKSAAQLLKRISTEALWEMVDIEAWHLRAEHLN
ncbi:hypothetical protein EVAR_76260_1 [Eumeta japonica]|uniref:Uncharacterized protein n=1 Tax=Eumeta variegata TaxID=151549 RepID=A0A4C1UP15_EUMVA|nr:hypothetical protein EVAR_76260_1 [Eumeta japonica]